MPDYRHLGSVRTFNFATEEYNRKLLSVLKAPAGSSIILDCNCGMSSDSAPQVLNAMGADVVSLNAQKDRNFTSRSMNITDSELKEVRQFVETDPGAIAVILDRIGSKATVVDEKGHVIEDEKVLALLVMFLRPRCVVVPANITSLVEDAFWGRIDVGMVTPFEQPPDEERRFIRAPNDAGTICDAMTNDDADIGFHDGGVIFNDISLTSDGIHTAAIVAQMSAENSLNKMVSSFPEYYRDSRQFHYKCTRDEFSRMIEDTLESVKCNGVENVDGWKVDMDSGWFMITLDEENDDTVSILAESTDRAYLIGLMEIAGDIIDECSMGQ